MKSMKRFAALGLAAALLMSSNVAVLASDTTDEANAKGTATGSGGLEGFVDKDIFTVTLPTTTDLAFNLDPQELLLATSSQSKFDASALAAGYGKNVLFKSGTDYVSKSLDTALQFVNKSTFDVDVTLTAKLTGLADETAKYEIGVVDAVDESKSSATEIAMAITPTTNTLTGTTAGSSPSAGTAVALTAAAEGVTVSGTIAAADDVEKAYKVTGSTGSYTYGIDATAAQSVAFNTLTYNLSGTVNTKGDWTNFSKASAPDLKVEVTYSVAEHVDVLPTPAIADATYSRASTTNTYAITNLSGRTVKLVTIYINNEDKALTEGCYSLSSDSLIIDGTKCNIGTGAVGQDRILHVTLSDDTVIEFTISVGA